MGRMFQKLGKSDVAANGRAAIMALSRGLSPCLLGLLKREESWSEPGRGEEGNRAYELADRGRVFSASTLPGFPLQEVWHLPIGAIDTQAGAGNFESEQSSN